MSKRSSTTLRSASASWPSGIITAVSEPLYSAGLRHRTSSPQARTARRVASACRCVAREHVGEAFLAQHRERLVQAVEQVGRRRGREIALAVHRDHLVPAPVRARQLRRLARGERLVADRVERQARRQHQALLRAGDGDVDAPFVVAVVDRGERRDRVDHQQRRMAGAVDRLAHVGDARRDAGRRLVVHDAARP